MKRNRWTGFTWVALFGVLYLGLVGCKSSVIVDPSENFPFTQGSIDYCAQDETLEMHRMCKVMSQARIGNTIVQPGNEMFSLLLVRNNAMLAFYQSKGVTEEQFLADTQRTNILAQKHVVRGLLKAGQTLNTLWDTPVTVVSGSNDEAKFVLKVGNTIAEASLAPLGKRANAWLFYVDQVLE